MYHTIRELFVCDGGSSRCRMAETLLRNVGGEAFAMYSAGLEAEAVHPLASAVMREIGMT